MDTTTLVLLVVFVALAVVVLGLTLAARRGGSPQEAGRTTQVDRAAARQEAESELRQRASRRDRVVVRELPAARRRQFEAQWRQVQEDFVDRPDAAVDAAQPLVTELMRERGYPVDDRGVVPFDPTGVMGEYRMAQRISALNDRGEATTDQLRQALVHYRSLFGRLLGTGESRYVGPDPYPQEQPTRSRERR